MPRCLCGFIPVFNPCRRRSASSGAIAALLLVGAAHADQSPNGYAPDGQPVHADRSGWWIYRGEPALTGVAEPSLPERLDLRWRVVLPEAIESSAAIVAGVVYVGCDDGKLYALDLADGTKRWEYQARGGIRASPTVFDRTVYVGDEEGVMHAVDAATGRVRWTFETQGEIISSANVHQRKIIFGSYDGFLYCLDGRVGGLVWKYAAEDRLHGTPGIADQHVMIAGCDAQLHVLNVKTGEPERKIALDAVCGAAAAIRGDRIYVGTYGAEVLGIDWQDGRVLWRYKNADREFPYMASAAVGENVVIVGGRDKRIHALDPQSGEQRWEFAARGRVDSSPVIVRDGPHTPEAARVFIGASDGNLYELDVRSGEQRWRFETGGQITASPAVADGMLIIGTLDGVLYCFGGRTEP